MAPTQPSPVLRARADGQYTQGFLHRAGSSWGGEGSVRFSMVRLRKSRCGLSMKLGMNSPARQAVSLSAGQRALPVGHRASRRSLASRRSVLWRVRRPKLLSGCIGRPCWDLKAGGRAHWEQRVLLASRRASTSVSVRRLRRGSVKESSVLVLHRNAAVVSYSRSRRHRA